MRLIDTFLAAWNFYRTNKESVSRDLVVLDLAFVYGVPLPYPSLPQLTHGTAANSPRRFLPISSKHLCTRMVQYRCQDAPLLQLNQVPRMSASEI